MLTSKERADLRGKATTIDTTLIVGKGGVTEALVAEADNQLLTRELIKGKVLEGALLTPKEAADAICEATGAQCVGVIGTKFVLYRFSPKLHEKDKDSGRAKRKELTVAMKNPVRKGAQARRQAMRKQREQRNEYFRQNAIEKAIEREKTRHLQENKD